jgi:hypothetical protein
MAIKPIMLNHPDDPKKEASGDASFHNPAASFDQIPKATLYDEPFLVSCLLLCIFLTLFHYTYNISGHTHLLVAVILPSYDSFITQLSCGHDFVAIYRFLMDRAGRL